MSDRTCTIEGCGREYVARGWCLRHYRSWQSYGDPNAARRQGPRGLAPLERIVARVVVDENGCWVWQGSVDLDGYGRIRAEGQTKRCHRVTYEAKYGPIPEGLQLDHFACDNPPCCNPDHVRPVTNRENTLRADGMAARHAAKTGCPHGHGPYNRVNPRTGGRFCSVCWRDQSRKRRARRLASA